jgi:hypothetical protein
MFERFTQDARNVVVAAQQHARQRDDAEITRLHLLLALISAGPVAQASAIRGPRHRACCPRQAYPLLGRRQKEPAEISRSAVAAARDYRATAASGPARLDTQTAILARGRPSAALKGSCSGVAGVQPR